MRRSKGGPNLSTSKQGEYMTYNRMEAQPIAGEHCRFCGVPQRRWSKHRVVSSGYVAIPPFYRFEVGGDAKSSMSALACVIPTMRIGMGGRGQAARNAGSSGRHEITDSTPRTPLTGPDIEAWAEGHEAQIMRTKSAREEAFLDTLNVQPYKSRKTKEKLICTIWMNQDFLDPYIPYA